MVLDLIIILIILLFTFLGYKKGLVKTAIGVLSFLIALVISIMLYKTVGNMIINNTQIDEKIENTITSKVTIEDLKEKYNVIPDSLIKTGEETVNDLARTLAYKIIYIVTFIILYIVIKIALLFAKFLAGIITKIPVIKQIDKLRRNNSWIWKRIFNSYSYISSSVTSFTNNRSKVH